MLKKFANRSEALNFGREYADHHHCAAYACSVYGAKTEDTVTVIASTTDVHRIWNITNRTHSYTLGSWAFGLAGVMADSVEGKALLALAENEVDLGDVERCYHLLACHSTGYTHEQKLEIAQAMSASGNGVWHECNAHYNRTHNAHVPCPCGRCKKATPS